jgi:hypothetical protein
MFRGAGEEPDLYSLSAEQVYVYSASLPPTRDRCAILASTLGRCVYATTKRLPIDSDGCLHVPCWRLAHAFLHTQSQGRAHWSVWESASPRLRSTLAGPSVQIFSGPYH